MIAGKPLRGVLTAVPVVMLAFLIAAPAFPRGAEKSEAGLLQMERQWLAVASQETVVPPASMPQRSGAGL